MENNLFEVGADIDVEALMSRLRESVEHRQTAVAAVPSPKEPEQINLKALQPQHLTEEIHSGALSAGMINEIPVKSRGTIGKIELRAKGFLKWLVHWNTKGQVEFNSSVMGSLELIAENLQTSQANFATVGDLLQDIPVRSRELELKINRKLEQIRKDVEAVAAMREDLGRNARETRLLTKQVSSYSRMLEKNGFAAFEQKMGRMIEVSAQHVRADLGATERTLLEEMDRTFEQSRSNTASLAAQSSVLMVKLQHELDELRMKTLRAERIAKKAWRNIDAQLHGKYLSDVKTGIPHEGTNEKEKGGTEAGTANGEPVGQGFDYFVFEHQHRGPVSEIKRRQSTYLELFLDRQNVADLGCGRGEFVELLRENGINVTGVDSNEDMVDFCRDRGLAVVQADIYEYLADLPAGELDGIFLSQVVEHLSPDQILKLLSLCAEKLEPGAVIVVETMNTNCPAALSNFYLDPTHIRPVPAELLRFMMEQAFFETKYVRFTSPLSGKDLDEVMDLTSGLNREAMLYQDYAIVAVRR